jgi:hypothetical protein
VSPPSQLDLRIKALRQLGLRQTGLFAWHRLCLRTGVYRRATHQPPAIPADLEINPQLLALPEPGELRVVPGARLDSLLEAAAEIQGGSARLFGGLPAPLQLTPPSPLKHWTALELAGFHQQGVDIKLIWEPARFDWACTLARAYHLTGDESYARTFWEAVETFWRANPPYLGWHWTSAQEVALRLIAWSFCWTLFQRSPETTPERRTAFLQSIAAHAARLPVTLAYARAQHNNHLLSEAAGLYTAGLLLPNHPQARRWRELGWRWFDRALLEQITPEGVYSQHSASYHRLVLQLALWMQCLRSPHARPFSATAAVRLAAATRWLLALVDPGSGRLPNLGPNDGAYLLPLSNCAPDDYRPILQAAAAAFLGTRPFPSGPWDELGHWHGLPLPATMHPSIPTSNPQSTPHILRSTDRRIRIYLRAAHFTSRPGHADQLHLDLWYRGLNLALDPGTYSYNAPPPWDNPLAHAAVHNTVTINGQDQMTRAGRFMYLDWAQAEFLGHTRAPDDAWERITARHDGYRRLGVIHQRAVSLWQDGKITVEDELQPLPSSGNPSAVDTRLHWLLPDSNWQLENISDPPGFRLTLETQRGPVTLRVTADHPLENAFIYRAGLCLTGDEDEQPTWGWYSPTYNLKLPALSFSVTAHARPPFRLASVWELP